MFLKLFFISIRLLKIKLNSFSKSIMLFLGAMIPAEIISSCKFKLRIFSSNFGLSILIFFVIFSRNFIFFNGETSVLLRNLNLFGVLIFFLINQYLWGSLSNFCNCEIL